VRERGGNGGRKGSERGRQGGRGRGEWGRGGLSGEGGPSACLILGLSLPELRHPIPGRELRMWARGESDERVGQEQEKGQEQDKGQEQGQGWGEEQAWALWAAAISLGQLSAISLPAGQGRMSRGVPAAYLAHQPGPGGALSLPEGGQGTERAGAEGGRSRGRGGRAGGG